MKVAKEAIIIDKGQSVWSGSIKELNKDKRQEINTLQFNGINLS